MKKIYLSFLSVFALSALFAQVDNVTEKRKSERVKPMISRTNPGKVISNPVASNRVTYLTEDFEASTFPPTGWTEYSGTSSSVTDPNQEWHLQTVGGYPQNTDAFNGTAVGGCAAINYVNSVDQHDEWLVSPAVTLPMNDCRVAFDFASSPYWHVDPAVYPTGNFDNADIQVLLSTDGGTTWSTVLWQEDSLALLTSSYSDGWLDLGIYIWSRGFVDLSAYQGQSVTLGWNYDGLDGAPFYLDNVSVEDVPDNEIAVLKAWAGDVVQDYDYSMVPTAQTKPMRVGTVVRNLGGLSQTFDVSVDITDGSGSVYTGTQSLTQSPAQIDTVWFDSAYTPTAVDNYTVTFTLPTDEDNSNNTGVATQETTTFMYAHDFDAGGVYGFDDDNLTKIGTTFAMEANADLMAVDVEFETGTTDGIYLLIEAWQVGAGGIQDLTQVGSIDYTVGTADIASGNPVTIIFDNAISLIAGESYVIQVAKVNGTPGERLYVGGSDEGDDDLATVCYGDFGSATPPENYYIGWGFSPAVRANFDPSLSVDNVDAMAGVSVFPNPSNGVITVTNDEHNANTIEVLNVAGKVVYTTAADASTTIDLSANGTGVYFVKVSNDTASFTERVVIK